MIFRLIKLLIVAGSFMAIGAFLNENLKEETEPIISQKEQTPILKEKIIEVEKKVPVYVYVEKGKYAIQIGSFLSKKFAKKLKFRLEKYYAISIKEERYGKKNYLVVFAEGFPSLKVAKEAKDLIDKKEEVNSIIIKRF